MLLAQVLSERLGFNVSEPPPPAPSGVPYQLVFFATLVIGLLSCLACVLVVSVLGRYGTNVITPPKRDAAQLAQPLATSAVDFRACLLPEGDIDLYKLERSCRYFADNVMSMMGFGGRIMASATHDNQDKVRHALATYEITVGMPPGRSLRQMYMWEQKQKLHAAGGMIADPSAAMGVLWCRHGARPSPPSAHAATCRVHSRPAPLTRACLPHCVCRAQACRHGSTSSSFAWRRLTRNPMAAG